MIQLYIQTMQNTAEIFQQHMCPINEAYKFHPKLKEKQSSEMYDTPIV